MIKIISNKYFLFTLLLLRNFVAFAHDCSSPGDCEETAGYNAALAITGGIIALGAGLISTWMPPDVPDIPEGDFGEAFDSEFDEDEEFSDIFDEGNEDKFDEDEFDSDEGDKKDEDEFDSDEGDKKDDDEKDYDEGVEKDDDEKVDDKKVGDKKDDDKKVDDKKVGDKKVDKDVNDKSKKTNVGEKKEDDKTLSEKESKKPKSSIVLDETQKIVDTSNNIKTLVENLGTTGVSIWQGLLKGKEYGKATDLFLKKIKNLRSKGLGDLANKYGLKLKNLLQNKANKLINLKIKGAKTFFGNLDKIKGLGHLSDGLTFLNNLNKKISGKHAGWDVIAGAVSEEITRVVVKTILTKNPVVAVADAALSLAGGPNLDYIVDKTLDTYKKAASKIGKWMYKDPKSNYAKFNSDFDFQKKRIDKMNLSPSEKDDKLRKVWKILNKSHGL